MPEEDRVMNMDNMHKNLVKIVWFQRYAIGQTDRQTHKQMHSSQYLATAPAGDVTKYTT